MDCKALGEEEEGKEDKRGREEEKKRKSGRKMGKWLLSQVVAAGLCSVMSGGNFAVPQRHRSHRLDKVPALFPERPIIVIPPALKGQGSVWLN